MHMNRIVASAVLGAVGLIAAAPASSAAGGGYGSGNTPAAVPGGYATVVTTHTFGSGGGSLGASVPGGHAQLTVPAGAFVGALQIAVTAPDLKGVEAVLPRLGRANYRVVAAIGIGVTDTNGHKFTGTFAYPLTLTITGAALGVGNQVIQFTGPSTATTVAATMSAGAVTVSMLADPDFAVLAPAAAVPAAAGVAPPGVSPPATSSAVASPAVSPSATSSAPVSSAGAGALTSPNRPTQVLGETLTRPSRGVSTTAIVLGIAIVVLLGTPIVAARRRSAGRHPAQVAYAGKHSPKPAAYASRHGTRLVTRARRH